MSSESHFKRFSSRDSHSHWHFSVYLLVFSSQDAEELLHRCAMHTALKLEFEAVRFLKRCFFPESKYIIDILLVAVVETVLKHLLMILFSSRMYQSCIYFGVKPPLVSSNCQPFKTIRHRCKHRSLQGQFFASKCVAGILQLFSILLLITHGHCLCSPCQRIEGERERKVFTPSAAQQENTHLLASIY